MNENPVVIHKRFETPQPVLSVPRLTSGGEEIRSTPAYAFEGKYRGGDHACVFQYTLRGEGVFWNQTGEHRVPAGSGFLCWLSDPETGYHFPPGAAEPWRFVYVNLIGGALRETVRELTERHGPVFQLAPSCAALRKVTSLLHQEPSALPFREAAAAAALLLDALFERCETLSQPQARREHELVREIKEHVQTYYWRNLNVADIAIVLQASREHLSRTFRRQTGLTIYQYILREKIVRACHMLKDTRMSSKEVGAALGFDQPAHFIRAFRRLMQMTPRRFREVGAPPVFPV